jgi:3-methyladenine DNA glycosylase AlkD
MYTICPDWKDCRFAVKTPEAKDGFHFHNHQLESIIPFWLRPKTTLGQPVDPVSKSFTQGANMPTVKSILSDLEHKGTEQTKKTFARHGITGDVYGVSIADLKVIARQIKGQQQLALELYETGNHDAMYLAGIVADGSQMTKKQLEDWAKSAPNSTIATYTVPGVAVESEHARSLAKKWIKSKTESLASCGWCTYAGLLAVSDDEDLDLDEIAGLLDQIEETISTAPNKVRYTMNGFVIAVGSYVKPLLENAKATAKAIGTVDVDMGETACKVPLATDYIAKIENMGRVGKKRKTIKC